MLGLGRQGLGCDGETLSAPCSPASPVPATAPGCGEGGAAPILLHQAPPPSQHFPLLLSFLFLFSLHGELATARGRDSLRGAGLGLPGVPAPRRSPARLTPPPAFPTVCGYFCHPTCAPQAPPCPVPPDLLHTALGVHPETGTGTAYEGFLSVSRRWGRGGRTGRGPGPGGTFVPACLPPGATALGCPAGLAASVRRPQRLAPAALRCPRPEAQPSQRGPPAGSGSEVGARL